MVQRPEQRNNSPVIINERTISPESVLNQNKISDLNTQNGKLQYKATLYKKPLNQKTIQNRLATYFKDIKKGQAIANFLLQNREKVERVSLRRKIDKKKKISL